MRTAVAFLIALAAVSLRESAPARRRNGARSTWTASVPRGAQEAARGFG